VFSPLTNSKGALNQKKKNKFKRGGFSKQWGEKRNSHHSFSLFIVKKIFLKTMSVL
jgi:hypothetical protein